MLRLYSKRKPNVKKLVTRIVEIDIWLVLCLVMTTLLMGVARNRVVREWQDYIDTTVEGIRNDCEMDFNVADMMSDFYETIHETQARLLAFVLTNKPQIVSDDLGQEIGLDDFFVLSSSGRTLSRSADLEPAVFEPCFREIIAQNPDKQDFAGQIVLPVSGDQEEPAEECIKAFFSRTGDGRIAVALFKEQDETADANIFASISSSQQSEKEFDIVVHPRTGALLYFQNRENLKELTPASVGLTGEMLRDGWRGWYELDGVRYLAAARTAANGCVVLHACRESDVMYDTVITVALMTVFLLGLSLLIQLYARFIRQEDKAAGRTHKIRRFRFFSVDLTLGKKTVVVTIIGLICMLAFGVYCQALLDSSDRAALNGQAIERLVGSYAADKENEKALTALIEKNFKGETALVERILRGSPELLNRRSLAKLSDGTDIEYIMVFDSEGKLIATDSPYSGLSISMSDQDDPTYPLVRVLRGGEPVVIESFMGNGDVFYIGTCFRDQQGAPNGVMVAAFSKAAFSQIEISLDLAITRAELCLDKNSMLLVIDKDTGKVSRSSQSKLIGYGADELGLKQEQLTNSYRGVLSMQTVNYIAESAVIEQYVVMIAATGIYAGNMLFAVVMVLMLGCLLLLTQGFTMCLSFKLHESDELAEECQDERARTSISVNLFDELCDSGARRSSISAEITKKTIFGYTPQEKMRTVSVVVAAAFICVAGTLFIANDNISKYILWGQWTSNINIFSASYCISLTVFVSVFALFFQSLFRLLARLMDRRAATICRMLRSGTVYLAAIICLMGCMHLVGVDTDSIIKSMGIMSIIVGLGAQKFIGDLIAGLFTIFEGTIHVGDIVTVNGNYGVVKEIGLRTISIVTKNNDIVVLNNSTINNITNLSRFDSVVSLQYTIARDDQTEDLVRMLKEELKEMEKSGVIPKATHSLTCDIAEMKPTNAVLLFTVGCDERNKEIVQRALMREVIRLLEKHGVVFC